MSEPKYVGVIFLLEGNPGDVRLTQEIFREAELYGTHYVANDGDEALDLLNQRGDYVDAPRPNMILLDWHFPKKSGEDVLKAINSDENLKRVPVVVLTGVLQELYDLKSENPGADAYVLKPLEPADLIRIAEEFSLDQGLL